MDIENVDQETNGYFKAVIDGREAGKMTYSRSQNNQITIDHTEVNSEYQGKGVGKAMVEKSAEFARNENLKISPQCSYAKKVMERSSDFDDVLV
ncbi:MAG TPA: GNAT family N-acetyltransferase [Gillisia sp.]|nr:GNAT family N-acetyltransferase [Gillisia sp.]